MRGEQTIEYGTVSGDTLNIHELSTKGIPKPTGKMHMIHERETRDILRWGNGLVILLTLVLSCDAPPLSLLVSHSHSHWLLLTRPPRAPHTHGGSPSHYSSLTLLFRCIPSLSLVLSPALSLTRSLSALSLSVTLSISLSLCLSLTLTLSL